MPNPVTYTAPKPNAVVFFLCPYTASHKKLMWAIKKLTRVGFLVVVYEYPREIFTSGDPSQLFDCIAET